MISLMHHKLKGMAEMKEIKMYIQIQELKGLGFSKRKTAKTLFISRDTVKTYWDLSPEEYVTKSQRIRKQSNLSKYEPVMLNWLSAYPSMTSAQVYDWLLEHYKVDVSERAVRRYVGVLRKENGIEKTSQPRDYESVDELPMGHQMQVDFGEKSMRTPDGQYVKVHFIGVVLSHSRYKWGYFLDRPFCSADLVRCLDMCFAELGGVTHELVFDQDSIVAINENYGDIIYTYEFEKYRQRLGLNIRLCRKADPESKGKVESVVKYVKINFLPNRLYMGLDILNRSFEEWLVRTGNGKVHGTTKKVPAEVFELERTHLRPILFTEDISTDESIYRKVRKDNTILYESNRYSLPLGTYNKEKEVKIETAEDKLVVWQAFGDYIIAEHPLSHGKGQLIKNNNHRRNTEQGIDELFSLMSNQLDGLGDDFLSEIRKRKSRYVRDQYGLIDTLIQKKGVSAVITAIEYCRKHELFSATDLRDTLEYLESQAKPGEPPKQTVIVMPITNPAAVAVVTQKRSIGAYAGLGVDVS
jgi:transposase